MLDKNPAIVRAFDYKWCNHPLFREFFDIYLDDFFEVNVTDYGNMTDDYNNTLLPNFTNSENDIGIFIPTLLLTTPWSIIFCLMSWMVYKLTKPLLRKKRIYQITFSPSS